MLHLFLAAEIVDDDDEDVVMDSSIENPSIGDPIADNESSTDDDEIEDDDGGDARDSEITNGEIGEGDRAQFVNTSGMLIMNL